MCFRSFEILPFFVVVLYVPSPCWVGRGRRDAWSSWPNWVNVDDTPSLVACGRGAGFSLIVVADDEIGAFAVVVVL